MRTKQTIDQRGGQCDKVVNLNLKACNDDGSGGVNGTQGSCTLAECRAMCEAHTAFKCSYYSYDITQAECYLFEDCKNLNTKKSMDYESYRLDGGSFDGAGDHQTYATDIYKLPRCYDWQSNLAWTDYGFRAETLANMVRCVLLFACPAGRSL